MMKLLRILLFPIVPVYFAVTWLRNLLYDKGIKVSKEYSFPVLCVGNLSTGGTGKTPMVEYLVRLLSPTKNVATLSRGYKRVSRGYVLAGPDDTVDTIGDEPLQYYKKFKNINVAVDESRQNGISKLRSTIKPQPEVILLDDAFQHRKVKAGLNILLTSYDNLYYKDIVLPTGNLREPKSGADRAQIIVVTKCPKDLSTVDKENIKSKIKPKAYQSLFFSSIKYSDNVLSSNSEISLDQVPKFTLVTGIANAKPLVDYLTSKTLNFDHLEYGDHYNFTIKDVEVLEKKDFILATEKDYVRLYDVEILRPKLYYIPIEITLDRPLEFDKLIAEFVEKSLNNSKNEIN